MATGKTNAYTAAQDDDATIAMQLVIYFSSVQTQYVATNAVAVAIWRLLVKFEEAWFSVNIITNVTHFLCYYVLFLRCL